MTSASFLSTGVPPYCHGTEQAPLDLELQCLRKGVHIFVEKPVSLRPPEEFLSYVEHVEELQRAKGLVVSVGYMFRYHPAIKKMKEILSQHSRPLLHVNARYNCTYAALDHPFWWNKDKSGGPIVEQATHFCDLMRYFGGEVDLPKLRAICVPPSDDPTSPGSLSRVPEVVREGQLLLAQRIPRATCAQFCFTSGALGSLTHAAALQGRKYEAQIDVWADGLRMALEEPYFPECKLRVRIGKVCAHTSTCTYVHTYVHVYGCIVYLDESERTHTSDATADFQLYVYIICMYVRPCP